MHLPALPREACGAKVISPYESTIEMGAQSQQLCHVISQKTVACTQISAGLIVMPPYGQKIGTCQFIDDYMPATIPPAACLMRLSITLPSNAATK
jgi:hypothetical protein